MQGRNILAVGADIKNRFLFAENGALEFGPDLGDLGNAENFGKFERRIRRTLENKRADTIAYDLHPGYFSTRWALRNAGVTRRLMPVQHHQAHVAACAAENDLRGPYLGVGWDGTGYGLDGTVWGGEFFAVADGRFERVAHPRPFRLPGGEVAVREGWRSAAGLLFETFGTAGLRDVPQAALIERMLERGLNAPVTTSVGRLFDAAAALAGVARESRFEGQAAMLLERAIDGLETAEAYPLGEDGDWRPMVEAMVEDRRRGVERPRMAARFHNALAEWIVKVAVRAGLDQVALSGGVFQNSYLVERAAALLEARGFRVATHQRVPANDGGIALGQAVLAAGMEV